MNQGGFITPVTHTHKYRYKEISTFHLQGKGQQSIGAGKREI